jgi:hypothetical protein
MSIRHSPKSSEGESKQLMWWALGRLPSADVAATAVSARQGDSVSVHVTLRNRGNVAAIQNKLTLVSATDGSRILPAYYDDNCISLLPGETHEIEIEYPATVSKGLAQRSNRLVPDITP